MNSVILLIHFKEKGIEPAHEKNGLFRFSTSYPLLLHEVLTQQPFLEEVDTNLHKGGKRMITHVFGQQEI